MQTVFTILPQIENRRVRVEETKEKIQLFKKASFDWNRQIHSPHQSTLHPVSMLLTLDFNRPKDNVPTDCKQPWNVVGNPQRDERSPGADLPLPHPWLMAALVKISCQSLAIIWSTQLHPQLADLYWGSPAAHLAQRSTQWEIKQPQKLNEMTQHGVCLPTERHDWSTERRGV